MELEVQMRLRIWNRYSQFFIILQWRQSPTLISYNKAYEFYIGNWVFHHEIEKLLMCAKSAKNVDQF